jgi:hypothetical protein
MSDSILYGDFHHLYSLLLHTLNIDTILWIGSYSCPFFTTLLQDSTIQFLTVDSKLNISRASLYRNEYRTKISYIYVELEEHIDETIRYFTNAIIFTPVYSKKSNYVCLPLTPTMYCMIPNRSLSIEYLPTIGRVYNFNASVCLVNKQPLYSIRSSDSKFTHSDLEFLYEDSSKRTSIPYSNVCREDLRLFTWKGRLYGSYTRITPYVAGVRTNNTLAVGRFDHDASQIQLVEEIVPPYGGNLTNAPEKNWTWWESPSGSLYCVYTFSPFKLLEFTDLSKSPREITVDTALTLPDLIRGGACGYIYDGKVWCFTHTITEKRAGFFNIGVVVLSHTEVPRVLGYCNTLVASKDYMNIFFYICGSYFDIATDSWKLTGGVQDSKACSITIPHSEVLAKTGLNN